MSAAETIYAARFKGPEFLSQGRDNVCTCPLRRAGANVTPDAGGTVVVRRADGTTVTSGTITVSGGVATYTIASATIASETRRADYRIEWTLSVGGVFQVYRRGCIIGRSRLHPVIDDTDLTAGRHSDLADLRPSTASSYQDYIDEAWEEIIAWLRGKGSLAHLVMDPEATRLWHLYQSLALAFNDFTVAGDPDGKWERQRDRYERKADAARDELTLTYDTDDDGVVDVERRPVTPVTFLAVGGSDPWGW